MRAIVALIAPLCIAASADVARFRPPATHSDLLGSESATLLSPYQWSAGAVFSYAYNPLTWRYPDGTYDPVIAHQLLMDVTFAAGIWHGVDLGVVMPVALWQSGPAASLRGLDGVSVSSLSGAGVGDLRLVPRFALLNERSFGVGLAVVPEFTLPTGDERRFRGDPSVGFRPRLVASMNLDRLLPLRTTASVAYRVRKNAHAAQVEFADEIEWHAGGELRVWDEHELSVLAELSGAQTAAHPFTGDGLFGLELLSGVRARQGDLIFTVGGAVGFSQGLGTPDLRAIVGVALAPVPSDRDGDGLPDHVDACPDAPEDYDRFLDDDGCPELDNDQDGILDLEDSCPDVAEDKNGKADDDGCPDAQDRDADGIPDELDSCPDTPEDKDGFKDDDGCPDNDNDQDGVEDADDKCPQEKETINGVEDDDGCPDQGEGETEYIENVRIEIKATIRFETSKATIKGESKNLLDQVALQILAHPDVKKVRVEGHTDSVGPADDNLYLSQDRADSVRRYLVTRGVAKERLEAVGYGETRPIDSNTTSEGRAKNRRVEFVIVRDE